MADDHDAVSRAWLDYANGRATVAEQGAFCAGFRAGLAHARQWRPLTDDPKTWPEEGQRVATLTRSGLLAAHSWFVEVGGRAVDAGYTTHWLPLPEPPKEKSEGEERMSDIDIAIRRFDLSEYEGWCMELVNELLTEYPAGEILWVDPGSGDDD